MLPNYNFVNLPQGSLRPPSDVMMPSRPSTVFKTADNMSRSGISGNDNWYYTSNSSVEMELRMRRTEETTRNLEVNLSHMTLEVTHAMRNLTQHISQFMQQMQSSIINDDAESISRSMVTRTRINSNVSPPASSGDNVFKEGVSTHGDEQIPHFNSISKVANADSNHQSVSTQECELTFHSIRSNDINSPSFKSDVADKMQMKENRTGIGTIPTILKRNGYKWGNVRH